MALRLWRSRKANGTDSPPPALALVPAPTAIETAEQLLRRVEWRTLRRLDGVLQGDYRTLFRGAGLDLADLREYQHHDDVRHIDWNVTARMQTPYVRQYREDRDLDAWFLLDLSPSAEFGSAERSKRQLTEQLTALLARLLTQRGNRCGALLYGLQGQSVGPILPPRSGRNAVLQLLHLMRGAGVTQAAKASASGPTRLAVLLERALETLKRRSAVVLISDFISEDGWQQPLMQLAARHDLLAVRVTDALEQRLPDIGLMTLEDPETGEQLFVDCSDPLLRERYAALAGEREAALNALFAKAGVDALELRTDDDVAARLLRLIHSRKQRSGAAARAARRA